MFSIQIDTKVFLYARLIDALEYDLMDHNYEAFLSYHPDLCYLYCQVHQLGQLMISFCLATSVSLMPQEQQYSFSPNHHSANCMQFLLPLFRPQHGLLISLARGLQF